jgi:hypothetical protein
LLVLRVSPTKVVIQSDFALNGHMEHNPNLRGVPA